ncbi:hypothetical protein [Kribbella jiaozuonensis]|uniref:Uncharacterized protein n=1 Tax=Kribbella jiaozuonensis TaxID=2575441 RepID=A0A4U3M164_9ACTN|nr:hypothetical protein [Kribbella jiaozuonensis]TKK81504.1 hypothetical protein FDA38_01210 [Kribbella jiaozuonensis]
MTTNDLRDLLRATAAEGSNAVDLAEDAVATRIRHRRTRSRRLAIGGAALTAAVVIAGTTWAVNTGGEQSPPAAKHSTVPPRLVQSDFDGPSGMEAALQTTLTADANGCVRAGQSDVTLVWPRDYTVRGDSKSFEILDGTNKVVARSGTLLTIGGGGADHFMDTWTGRDCATRGDIWMVGGISAAR